MSDALQTTEVSATLQPLHRDALVALLRKRAGEIRKLGVISLAIFGSRARGEEHPASDLDVLVAYDPEGPFTLYDLVRVERLLAGTTGLDVHVSTHDGFPPRQLSRILEHAVSVF